MSHAFNSHKRPSLMAPAESTPSGSPQRPGAQAYEASSWLPELQKLAQGVAAFEAPLHCQMIAQSLLAVLQECI